MRFPTPPTAAEAAADSEHKDARWSPDQDTLLIAAAGATQVLGHDHSATKALARASTTMTTADLWQARLALKTLRLDQREAIAAAAEG